MVLSVSGCVDDRSSFESQSQVFLADWFDNATLLAHSGVNLGTPQDAPCHGLGLLKHAEYSCSDMLSNAAQVDPSSRTLQSVLAIDCFADVCGDFMQSTFASLDIAGNEIHETVLVKRDQGQLRMYWYRTDAMLAALRQKNHRNQDDGKDPLHVAYAEVVARYPSLYEFPPCHGIRVTSTNLAGTLVRKDAIDVASMQAMASSCGELFCFGLVGDKIAPMCPAKEI